MKEGLKMKVLVFGANGKTGRLVVDRAIAAGHEVTVLVRQMSLSFPASVRVIVGRRIESYGYTTCHGFSGGCSGMHWRKCTLADADA